MSKLKTFDQILEQAFTDGASDTMWQNDRHVEIYATAKAALNRQALATALRLIGDDDRDYSKDNADEQSLAILVACSTACNEYKAELCQAFTDYYGGGEV